MSKGKQQRVVSRKPKARQATKQKTSRPIRVPKQLDPGFADAGQALGAMMGGPVGSVFGRLGGGLISKITGYGDYQVNSNTVASGQSVPTFKTTGDGYIISHREFVSDIIGNNTTGRYVSFSINPGLSETFPWLSQVAVNFEQYEMLGMVWEYRTTSGAATGSNTALGSVIAATNYDIQDVGFSSKVEVEAYEYSTQSVPSQNMMHIIECAPTSRPTTVLYVRGNDVTSGSQLNYDLGKTTILTIGQQGTNTVGELWVTYHVRLLKPKMVPNTKFGIFQTSTGLNATTSPLGPITTQINTLTGFVQISNTAFALRSPGYYYIAAKWTDAAAGISVPAGYAAFPSDISDVTTTYLLSGSGATNTSSVTQIFKVVKVLTTGVPGDTAHTLTLTAITGLTGTGVMDLVIVYLGVGPP